MAFSAALRARQPVAVDARMLGPGGTGVSTYARSLLAALPLVSAAPLLVTARDERGGKPLRVLRALPPFARRLRPAGPAEGIESVTARDIFRISQAYFGLYGRALPLRVAGPPGIMHWSYPVPLRLVGWRNVYTVHDMIPLDRPDLTPIDPRRHARLLRAIMRHAAALLTVSADARQAIVRATGCDDGFVVDCGQPVILPATLPLPPAGYAPGSYFLFCGSIDPRKNLARLAAAWRASGTALPLLLVGPDGWRTGEVLAAVAPGGGIGRLPYQDRAGVIGLIAHARAMLFPSLAEGFGLPVAEAMTLGTPVLTSTGVLAETAGGAALIVDPLDVAGMAAAIARLATDDALAATLAAAGRVRAQAFTLDRFAGRLAAFHDRLIASPPVGPYQRPT
ncbi:glycosyltransferase family 4 protein [Sphingomonas solaris]|uniref:Glycosyltransferase family 4 protein n=1 Tax=Alterirhizorhabdus solaris TaxID=2529389 RepID=A0A558R1W4_9SPHN|nr:glycosyltransferase family 1 protein [Sphingomonas solaris]TVV73373.1 glycosyltransferase family 4 protein [Sphingomonas solaris]